MTVLDSLPDRPLTDAALASFNRTDAVELAVDVTEPEREGTDDVRGLLLATDGWVKGLVYESGDWAVVETAALDGEERFDALRACEDAVRERRDE